MEHRYSLTDAARENLREISRYTHHQWGGQQRRKYTAALHSRFTEIAQSPLDGRIYDKAGTDLRYAKEGKHLIFYLTLDDRVLITHILHESMDIDARMERWTRP